MQELDGAMIVRLSEKQNRFVPLLYPTRQTLFQWIDSGDVDLMTYEQFVKNPGLFVKPVSPAVNSEFAVSAKHSHESETKNQFAETSPPSNQLSEPRAHPLPPLSLPQKRPLPGDPELQAFLERERIEEQPASNEKSSLSNPVISSDPASRSPIYPPPGVACSQRASFPRTGFYRSQANGRVQEVGQFIHFGTDGFEEKRGR